LKFAGSTLLLAAVNKYLSMPIVIKRGKLDQTGRGQGHKKTFLIVPNLMANIILGASFLRD